MRSLVHAQYGALLSAYVYADPQSLSAMRRQELSASGLDIIDCSRSSGKLNTVDFRIVTRALAELARPNAARPAVVLVTGDGDFCYTISTLRNVGVKTLLIFDSDRRGVVNSGMLQAAESVHGISFGGHDTETSLGVSEEHTPSSAAAVACTPDNENVELNDCAVESEEAILLNAIERSPPADDDGFRSSTSVGELFHRLRSTHEPNRSLRKAAFRAARSRLVDLGRVEMRNGTMLLRKIEGGGD
jgi:hypothetical protein